MKSAREVATAHAASVFPDGAPEDLAVWEIALLMEAAIEADRAQREATLTHLVIAEHGKDQPEAIVGAYATDFEAHAVAREWNRINRRYGITYRVEEEA